jgi:hypothetical protein
MNITGNLSYICSIDLYSLHNTYNFFLFFLGKTLIFISCIIHKTFFFPGRTSEKEPDVQPSQTEMGNDKNGDQHVQPLQTEIGNNQNVQPSQTKRDDDENIDHNVQLSQTETGNGQNGDQTKGNEADAPKE